MLQSGIQFINTCIFLINATILPSTCVVISDLLSVSCATVARKNLIGWCKQRDFFSRRIGARFMSISKPFYQHSGTICRRSKSYLVVRIFSDTVMENYGQVWLQFVMTACVFPRRPLAMLWHARGPEAATHDSWPAPKCCWNCIDILNFLSSFINKYSLLMQTEAMVHCQILQQTITCCNAELSLSNHRYIATWTLDGKISGKIWKVIIWGPLFTLEKCGIYTAHNSTCDYTTVPSNIWYKT